ncbi:MAG: AAA family ATPase [Lachnospiraceae bacterium]|nr:AAA family ATPase [Lachnospiraceae bacterium]
MAKLPLGIDDFHKLRSEGCYYVDKTDFISELLKNVFEVNLITRPRRFGKTLTMSMLGDFLDIRKDSRSDFAGLKICGDELLCEKWQNQWPVLFLSLKGVEGIDYEIAYARLQAVISDICLENEYLLESGQVSRLDKEIFSRLLFKTASREEVGNSLFTLTRMLNVHYGKQVVLLIDEYDVPLAKASESGYYAEMMDVIRAMLSKALKTNRFLKFALVTGCLKIAKESIFTGTNNFVSDTISDDRFDEYMGFTERDVQKILSDTGFTNHADEVRTWYDGYRFGSVDVYCPWDVLSHVAALQENPGKTPQNYWEATSHNGIIYHFISRDDFEVNNKFEILLNGGHLIETITADLTYDNIESTEENLWSLLYLTGYLTRAEEAEKNLTLKPRQIALRIPNEEVKSIFKKAVVEWFNASVKTADRTVLFAAMWNGDVRKAQQLISDLLFTTISYHDYKESYYHAFTAGLFAGAGYIVESNYEHGNGRPDVIVKDKKNRSVMVIEIKHASSEAQLLPECNKAIRQMQDRKYLTGFDRGYRTIIGYGIAFYEKECMLKNGNV